MWKTCTEVFETYEQDLWYKTMDSIDSPCSSNDDQDTALCTYSQNYLYMYCRGRYYRTKDTISRDSAYASWAFQQLGKRGGFGAIWEDSNDCDELEFEGWESVCGCYDGSSSYYDYYQDEQEGCNDDDGNNNEHIVCARNRFIGHVGCATGDEYYYYGEGHYKRI